MYDLYPRDSIHHFPSNPYFNFSPPYHFIQPTFVHPPPSDLTLPSVYAFYSKFDDLPYYSSIPLPSFSHSYIDESLIRSSRFYNEPPYNYDEENIYSARGLTHLISKKKERCVHIERNRREGQELRGEEEESKRIGMIKELRNISREMKYEIRRKEEVGISEGLENDILDKEQQRVLYRNEGKGEEKKDKSWEGYHSERIATAKKLEKLKMEDELTQRKIRRKLNYDFS